jgi:hypothetical protein
MPDSDEEAQKQVLEGICARLRQICVVCAILNGEDVITIAPCAVS